MADKIIIKGARVHNLKNIDAEIPRDKLVVITGLSGSGKSSLAFDTIYAEGQRRYVESLSAYARQFLGLMDKPDVDQIDGLSPAISIDQRSTSHNPRSTVGTVTEIYDYLRLLFAKAGRPHCPNCGQPVIKQTVEQIVNKVVDQEIGKPLLILAPIVRDQKGEHKNVLAELGKAGFARVRFDGAVMSLEEARDLRVDKKKKHNMEIVVDRLEVESDKKALRARAADSVEKALEWGNGLAMIHDVDEKKDTLFSQHFACPDCGISLPSIEPRSFSFNSPHGACPACAGLGQKLEVDPLLVFPNPRLTLAQGAIRPWSRSFSQQSWYYRILEKVSEVEGFSMHAPVGQLPPQAIDIILYGTGPKEHGVDYESMRFSGLASLSFEGVVNNLERRYKETDSDYIRKEMESYMRVIPCPACQGKRLKPEALAVKICGLSIAEITARSIKEARDFFTQLSNGQKSAASLTEREKKIAKQILKEIQERLAFLNNVGLDYLTLDRAAATLAGGEAQRIRLATQIGSSLMGVLYILDEPSIGLHQRDNERLIKTLKALRDLGNTVIVVEHDEATIRSADYVLDIGPGAGQHGGRLVARGAPAQIMRDKNSLTGRYLSGALKIEAPIKYRKGNGKKIVIKGAGEFNLKNIDVEIPLGKFVCLTGVSGSGKSTLMSDILAKALKEHFFDSKEKSGEHQELLGVEQIDKVIEIDQSPIGRTPRSNPATYTGLFTPIRDLFAELPESRVRGYKAGRFSFNVTGGRCEACQGDGLVRIEMQFLPDVYVECEECHGKRYNQEALDIHYKGKNISDVLKMAVEEAKEFFRNIPIVYAKLQTLHEVGLGYIQLGQSATTLSGGEAQRVKLSAELSRRATGRTLYLLDEPTTGLHFDDVKRLLKVLNALVDKGNTVLIIEHNLDVIKSADWLIDLGPEGGEKGGEVVAVGTPREVAGVKRSYTGQFLKKVFRESFAN